MQQKDYELIARALRAAKPPVDEYDRLKQWNITVESMTHDLAQDNPKFKPTYFHRAAGYGWKESIEPEESKAHRFDPKDIRVIKGRSQS